MALTACDDKPGKTKNTGNTTAPTVKPEPVAVPDFSADSAYAYIEKQLDFGPRAPGTSAHRKCGDWIVAKLKGYGATVVEQEGEVNAWDIEGNELTLPMRNIIASFAPEKGRRVVFSAHWDTRPFADQDNERQKQPIPGANDGGSGVAVLLEMASHFSKQNPKVGVDLFFWDVEDHGNPYVENSYCLGTQYWGRSPHKPGYKALYGINLDMVGAKGATFLLEGHSLRIGKSLLEKVWKRGIELGYQRQFTYVPAGAITDDHYYMNLAMGIPVIDIIDMRPNSGQTFFGGWHTHQDDIHMIDRVTLKAVGQTMLHIAYEEE
ncbi:MAG: M28 family peptidase [Bacteroidia bacterium]